MEDRQDWLLKSIRKSYVYKIRKLAKEKNLRIAGAIEFLVTHYEQGK